MIEARGLRKAYDGREVVAGVDLDVPAGGVLALLGPNGAGKTTTVRMLATLLRPDGGTARVAGHDVVRERAAVRRLIGLTGQSPRPYPARHDQRVVTQAGAVVEVNGGVVDADR